MTKQNFTSILFCVFFSPLVYAHGVTGMAFAPLLLLYVSFSLIFVVYLFFSKKELKLKKILFLSVFFSVCLAFLIIFLFDYLNLIENVYYKVNFVYISLLVSPVLGVIGARKKINKMDKR
jgi:hypothetical protein